MGMHTHPDWHKSPLDVGGSELIDESKLYLSAFSSAVPKPVKPSRPLRKAPRRFRSPLAGVPATINRWTGRPHEHQREIARRQRQAARAAAK